jgi:hypothetical protein
MVAQSRDSSLGQHGYYSSVTSMSRVGGSVGQGGAQGSDTRRMRCGRQHSAGWVVRSRGREGCGSCGGGVSSSLLPSDDDELVPTWLRTRARLNLGRPQRGVVAVGGRHFNALFGTKE